MTGRERILAAFRGEQPDAVPFCPNLYYWFYYHKLAGDLPPVLAQSVHPFDALRALGADILARWDTQSATRAVYPNGTYSEEHGGLSRFETPVVTAFNVYPPRKSEIRRRFVTPHGDLTSVWTLSVAAATDFESEHWWKDWSDFQAIRYMLESTDYAFDAAAFRRWVRRVGEDGVMMVHVTQSPLKTFHWLAGPENASLFLIDHPDEMRELAAIHTAKALSLVERTAAEPEAEIFMSLDNVDSAFYPPDFFKGYCQDFFTRAAEIVHSRGKIFVVHACGRNRVLMPLVGASGVDCLEGLTPPPAGDVDLARARALAGRSDFTVNGGMDMPNLEAGAGAETRLHDYTRRLFESMGDKRHFIFGSSCSTSPRTPWQNLVYFRDAAREQ
jgi:uroporphyrinogen-III decarboxylase